MNAIEISENIGIVAFALSGFYVATKDNLDLLGIFLASFLTALGGGIMRDVIASRAPYAFNDLLPGILVVLVLFFAILFKFHRHDKVEQKFIFILSDALGLVSFTISGSLVGINAGFNFFGIVLLGFTTAVGGGVLRDILINQVPWLLRTGLYGSVALIVGSIVYVCSKFDVLSLMSLVAIFIFGVCFRLLAYYRSWCLPVLSK